MAVNRVPLDDAGIPNLVRQLGNDSRRLVAAEIRLAKAELRESVQEAGRGAMWVGVAFGVAIVSLVAFSIFLVVLLAMLVGSYWAGAMLTGALQVAIALWLIKRGQAVLAQPSYTLEETRESVRESLTLVRR